MNRTDRLYAIVEELRAVAPRPRSARWLAERFGVSVRTVERDVDALQQAGKPVWAEPGRTGGYCLDPEWTLPPVNFTPMEAVALAVACEEMPDGPFRRAAQVALRKVAAAMHAQDADAARNFAARVHILNSDEPAKAGPPFPVDALLQGRVLRISYADREGRVTFREVEPLGYIEKTGKWYLLAWCRLRAGVRAFRIDRILSNVETAETPPLREFRSEELDIPYGDLRQIGALLR